VHKKSLLKWMNLWPPFLGAGIKVRHLSPDLTSVHVEMKLRFWNRNYVGTHFGGSLFAMTDPFLMLMLLENLGPDYMVWDKSATIHFRKPAKGTVHVYFNIQQEEIEQIRLLATTERKVEPQFQVQIQDGEGNEIAIVEKTLYVRKKYKTV
jgi:acyl-coenzyme A thioesterase PaaI-like protein